jgi:C-3',4' desaturase CrtD
MADTRPHIVIVGAGIGGLTAAALLAAEGQRVTVLEAQTYAGGSAGTFYHQGYRFDAGATVAGGFQPYGPHHIIGQMLDLEWPVRLHEPAWVVHLPDREVALTRDNADVLRAFPNSEHFWQEQSALADICWRLAAEGMPWPPQSIPEVLRLAQIGLAHFPRDVRLLPFVFSSAQDWIRRRGLGDDHAFNRFIDAQLLISAQTTAANANAVYSATALDLARQGVYHVRGGMGGIADALIDKIHALGGEVRFRQRVSRVHVEGGRVTGLDVQTGRRGKPSRLACDFLIANLTPWSLDGLLGEASPAQLRNEVQSRKAGLGAFVLHLGVDAAKLPADLPDHHQFVADMHSPLGEGVTVFMSMSPTWDSRRAPAGHRAVTITTHTAVQPWWDALTAGRDAYDARKADYSERLLRGIERYVPGFRDSVALALPGSPVTYEFYTGRHLGMVGGFPQRSLFGARGPRVGLPNARLVGDSIFPGQSTAGVSLGALRVARDVLRQLPRTRWIDVPLKPEKATS